MADAQDRRLPASERKIRKARAEGQVARSRDLSHFVAIGAGAALLAAAAPQLLSWLQATLAAGLRFDAAALADERLLPQRLALLAWPALRLVLGLGALMAVAALLAGVLSGGWNFSLKALQPRFDKIDPLAGLGRMVSPRQLLNTLKSCLLALIVGAIGVAYLQRNLPRFADALAMPLAAALPHAGTVVLGGLWLLVLALALFAIVDVPLQRHQLAKSLKMSVQEAKQEQREAEGSPETKQRQRARMREMANRRMLAAVPGRRPGGDEPDALRGGAEVRRGAHGAPRVVAKGKPTCWRCASATRARGQGAGAAGRAAGARAVRARRARPRVPAGAVTAVAQVLAHVYQLRAHLQGRAQPPAPLPELQVPAELDPQHSDAGAAA
jgi:flagellar biosynthetic protein FlhB